MSNLQMNMTLKKEYMKQELRKLRDLVTVETRASTKEQCPVPKQA
jgi:hypothetical protein